MKALYYWAAFLKRPETVTLLLFRLAKVNLAVTSLYVQWEFLSCVYSFAFNKCLPSAIAALYHPASGKPAAISCMSFSLKCPESFSVICKFCHFSTCSLFWISYEYFKQHESCTDFFSDNCENWAFFFSLILKEL